MAGSRPNYNIWYLSPRETGFQGLQGKLFFSTKKCSCGSFLTTSPGLIKTPITTGKCPGRPVPEKGRKRIVL
jgi:hypothetical protein